MNNLLKLYKKNKKNILAGFSLGTLGVLEIASKVNVDKIILVSPSPVYKDLRYSNKYLQRKNLKKMEEYAKNIKCEVEIYVGGKEDVIIFNVAKKLAKLFNIEYKVLKKYRHSEKLFEKVIEIEN